MPAGIENTERELDQAQRLAEQIAAEPAGANAVERHPGHALAESLAAAVGHQRHAAAAREQRPRQRFRRKHVAAGAAGGEHDEAGTAHVSTPPKRRRVSASAMHMPSATATIEEPP